MEKILYPNHPVRCIITGPSSSKKSVIVTNSILNIINEHDKSYNYSASLYQDLYQKFNEGFTNKIPIQIFPNLLNEEDKDLVIEEIVYKKDSEKFDTEIETYKNIEEIKVPQECGRWR